MSVESALAEKAEFGVKQATTEEREEFAQWLRSLEAPELLIRRICDLLDAEKIRYGFCTSHGKKCRIDTPDWTAHMKALEFAWNHKLGKAPQRPADPAPPSTAGADMEAMSDAELQAIVDAAG